jgi:predicted dehydrogenase
MTVRIGVVGCGYWGPNLVRTFLELPEASVVAVADRDPTRLDTVRARHPHVEHFVPDVTSMFDLDLDAVVISTPPETHHAIAIECLKRGLDVLVEKPLATDSREALELVELAAANERVMLVGHIGVYHPAVEALKTMIDDGDLGEIRYVDAVRTGLGLFHPSLNVVWDLAPHDVSILLYLLDRDAVSVSTRGVGCVRDDVEDVAYMTVMFDDGVLAHTRMSWLDPSKTRRLTVIGSEKMVVYDDLETLEKVKVYDKRVNAIRRTDTFGEFQFSYHYGSVVSPYIRFEEPLRLEALHFLDCVQKRTRPITDGRNGLEVVKVIEAAQASLSSGGVPVDVQTTGPAALADRGSNATRGDQAVLLDLSGNGHAPVVNLEPAAGSEHRSSTAAGA